MLRRLKRYLRRLFHPRRTGARSLNHPILMMERRRSPRVPSRNLIRILGRDRLQLDHLFNLADFSECGLRIRTDLDAHPGSTIEAIVNFRERNLHMDLNLRVVWVRPSRRGHAWGGQMGVEMTHLAPELRGLIKMMVIEKLGRLRAA
jgi:hypothetical protein